MALGDSSYASAVASGALPYWPLPTHKRHSQSAELLLRINNYKGRENETNIARIG